MSESPGMRLRALMDRGCVAMPGAFNGLCARAVSAAGFEACYVSGAATSVCAGVPDVGVLTLEHFCRVIKEVSDAARDAKGERLPVLADADTGFGEAEMVRRTVIEYARAGAAGLHLEDQEFPKRCGHLDGKRLVSAEHMVEKVEWAVAAARNQQSSKAAKQQTTGNGTGGERGSTAGFVVCARTDARGVEGIEGAIARAKEYVKAGADMIFPEGLASEEEFGKFAEAMGKKASRHQGTEASRGARQRDSETASRTPYLLANMTEFGKTPIIPLSKFEQMGYSCVIYPVSLLRVAMGAVTRALAQLKKDGSVAAFQGQMQTRDELYGLIGYTPGKPWEWPAG